MAAQTQGKGKKKNKEVMKFSLDEFNQINAPHGHSVVNVKYTGLDWAATMADHDQQVAETQQIIVPTAPRAQRGPDIDFESLPTEPPFRVSLFHVPIAADEKDITDRFFNGIQVQRVDIQKASTTVELASRLDMYEALCKDGSSIKGKTISVCLYGQQPQNNYNQERYGGRGSNSSYGDRSYQSGGFGSQRLADKYGDRSGGFNSDRDSYNSYNRASGGAGGLNRQNVSGAAYGQKYESRYTGRSSYRSRFATGDGEGETPSEPENWRARSTATSTSPEPSQTTPQQTASDEVENWRARSTVRADPQSATSSTEPPHKVSLFGAPSGIEERDVTDEFLSGIKVQGVDIQESSITVELPTREDMQQALCKDGFSIKGKTISVCMYGQQPQNNLNQDNYVGRGSNSSYGDRSYQGGGFGNHRAADKYGDRSGGFSSDRDSYNSYNRSGGGAAGRYNRPGNQGSGYGQRYENRYNSRNNNRNRYTTGAADGYVSQEPENWRQRETQQTPSNADEVENWRARSTVTTDTPTAPTS